MSLDHPLLGRRRQWTALGIVYVALITGATIVSAALAGGTVDFLPGRMIRLVDGFRALLIIAVVLSITVLPSIYALANGGPVIAIAIGITPTAVTTLVTTSWVLTNDAVVSMVGASVGGVVAVGTMRYHRQRDDGMASPVERDALLITTGVVLVSVVAVWRFDRSAPAAMVETIAPWHWLVLVPAVALATLWLYHAVNVRREGYRASR